MVKSRGRKKEWTRGEEVNDSERVWTGCRRIAREISESAYSWESERVGKTEFSGIGDKAE